MAFFKTGLINIPNMSLIYFNKKVVQNQLVGCGITIN